MRPSSIDSFVSQSLELLTAPRIEIYHKKEGHVLEGVLWANNQKWYPITEGVPCFLTGPLQPDFTKFAKKHGLPTPTRGTTRKDASEQAKTNKTFSDKWRRFKNYGLEPQHQEFLYRWYLKKFGLSDIHELKDFYSKKEQILECGPGSGFNSKFMSEHCRGRVFALDVSDAAFTTFENTRHLENCTVVQADLMLSPFPDEFFDFIIADGVLHHTPNTFEAVSELYRKLKPGGQFYFYVYRKMGAARVFCDEHIRSAFMQLEPEECYKACEGITELGRELSKIDKKITLEKSIPSLGIPAGTHDVQRLVYYNFLKCFWNDAFDYETNNMVNFDWYHPHNAWQHTEEEVASWLEELGCGDFMFNDSNPNGISTLLTKPK